MSNFTRRIFCKITSLAAATASINTMAKKTANNKLPNIIFILADDMGYGDIQYLNNQSKIPTPNLNKLAKEGMIFNDAHSNSAVCTPTRYGVLTGRYTWRTSLKRGVLFGFSKALIEPDRMTVASLLKQKKYSTACIGKWHLGMNWGHKENSKKIDYSKKIQKSPITNGFDYFYGVAASLDMPPYTFIHNDKVAEEPTIFQKANKFPAYSRAGRRAKNFTFQTALPTLVQKAKNFINTKSNQTNPFFLYLALTSPHKPIVPIKQFQGKSKLGPYGDFVMETDWIVGQILETLKKNKIEKNTLVIYTSDNASYMFRYSGNKKGHLQNPHIQGYNEKNHTPNYIFRGTKADIFEGGHRVPFIVRWPQKVAKGKTCPTTICLTDFMATCAEITNQTLPYNAAEDSFSILPYLLEQQPKKPRAAVIHHSINGTFAVRYKQWKLILSDGSGGRAKPYGRPGNKPYQLFNIQDDPAETKNIINKHPKIVAELITLVNKYKKEGRSR